MPDRPPDWVYSAGNGPAAPAILRASAKAIERYRKGEIKFVKLLDGGIVDNLGLAGFTIARLASTSPFGPLAPQEAVKLRRFLFMVVDSGRDPSGKWAQTVPGPSGIDLIMATSDTATESGAIGSYSAFTGTINDWKNDLIRWRCGLSEADRKRLWRAAGLELPRRAVLHHQAFRSISSVRRAPPQPSMRWRPASCCRPTRSTC